MARNNNRKVVPESRHMLNQMKYEIATELGIGSAYGSGGSGADTEFAGELGEIGGGFCSRRLLCRTPHFTPKWIGRRRDDQAVSPSGATVLIVTNIYNPPFVDIG